MSWLSVVGSLTEDLLETLRLKPWWESLREWSFKASLAIIVLFRLFPSTEFNCVPDDESFKKEFTGVESNAVNSYCNFVCIPWYIAYGDLVGLGLSLLTYICANFWIHKAGIKEKLHDVSRYGRSIVELNMSVEEMQNCSVLPMTASSDDKRHLLRSNVQILLKYPVHSTIAKLYRRRCALIEICTIIWSAFAFAASFSEINHPVTRTCEVPENILELGRKNASDVFTCIDETTGFIAMLEMIFGFTTLTQTIAMIVALKRQNYSTNRYLADVKGFLILMMGLDKRQSKDLRSFTNFVVTSSDFPAKLRKFSDTAIASGDMEHFRIMKKRLSDDEFWREVETVASIVLCDGDSKAESDIYQSNENEPYDMDYTIHLLMNNLFRILPTPSGDNSAKGTSEIQNFTKRLTETNKWHLLYCTLTVDQVFYETSSMQNIRFDELDHEGRSYLFYVLRKSSMDKLFERFSHYNELMKACGSKHAKFVHFDGKSMSVEDFFYAEYCGKFRGDIPNFRLNDMRGDDITHEIMTNQSNEWSEEFEKRYKAYFKEDTSKEATSICKGLNKLKLLEVSPLQNAAERALTMRHWEVLVALINTYIVVYKHGVRPKSHELIGNDVFNLRNCDSLEEIFIEALKRPRGRNYFVLTAAEHLLSLMKPEVRMEMIKHIADTTLSQVEKEWLKQLVHDVH